MDKLAGILNRVCESLPYCHRRTGVWISSDKIGVLSILQFFARLFQSARGKYLFQHVEVECFVVLV
jgi:hypothetical protein